MITSYQGVKKRPKKIDKRYFWK